MMSRMLVMPAWTSAGAKGTKAFAIVKTIVAINNQWLFFIMDLIGCDLLIRQQG